MKLNIRAVLKEVKRYFNLMDDREDEAQVVEQVSSGVVFKGTNLWILICAIMIASLGLNVNSTAVIIGAMLISPLMGPIIGIGFSVGVGDYGMLRQSLRNFLIATIISVLTATVYFLISPLNEARSELLARTSPSLYDVLIAFFGGAAGVLALTTKSKGQVIPGVAIATALMPPLCTAGYGLATAHWNYFFGAFYLFFINSVFIALATFLGVKMLRFKSHTELEGDRLKHGRRVITVIVIVTMLPASIMTFNIVRQNIFARNVSQFVSTELEQRGTQILSTAVEHDTLRVVAVGRPYSEVEIAEAQSRMGYYGMKGYALHVIQGTDGEDMAQLAEQMRHATTAAESERQRASAQVAELEAQLSAYTGLEALSAQVSAEAATLFPQCQHIVLGRIDGHAVALLSVERKLAEAERKRMEEWLATRIEDAELEIIYR